MKKYILVLLLLLLFPLSGSAFNITMAGSSTPSVTVCTETYAPSLTGDAYLSVSRFSAIEYTGFLYTPASNVDVCALDIYVWSLAGDPTSKGFYAQIWEIGDGDPDPANSLVTNLGTSVRLLGTNLAATTWISANIGLFEWASPVSLIGSTTYAVIVFVDTDSNPNDAPEYDGTNYITWRFDNENNGDAIQAGGFHWTYTSPTPHVVNVSDLEDDMLVKIHTME